MADLSLVWRQDIVSGATGDLALASGPMLVQQRLLRRLLTNPGDYIWSLGYGAGLNKLVGSPSNLTAIRAAIRSQVFLESGVSRLPEPDIEVQSGVDGSVYVQIRYVDATSRSTQLLTFMLGVST